MVTIKNEKLEMEEALKNKTEFICSFCNTIPSIINGNTRKINKTNLNYIEPQCNLRKKDDKIGQN